MTTTPTNQNASSQPGYPWAEHLIWMEGGEPVEAKPKESVWPGLCLVVALAALAFGTGYAVRESGSTFAKLFDPVLLSMLLGLLVGNLSGRSLFLPGVSMAVRKLLPFGIILLGARMDFLEAMRIGLPGLAMSLGVVGLAMISLYGLGRLLGLERDLACLLGVGTGICGGTAIVAIAPILRAKERDILVGVGLVTLVGLAAMILLPPVADWFGFTQTQFGLLAGLTIHQTPQVIAAGFAYGEEAGQVATVAKLARVCLLAPVAVGLGWWMKRRSGTGGISWKWYSLLPGFAVGFLLFAAVRTLGLLPNVEMAWEAKGVFGGQMVAFDTTSLLKASSSFFLAAGMVGVGFQTRFSQAREIGWRPVAAAVVGSLIVALFVLPLVRALF
ncbi:MAG: putative sulfate exporter family transporter [Verrucomicrobiales bacterium]|nr:putative sulfate exporter family transporter [Verrucomicrobiales bacterium]